MGSIFSSFLLKLPLFWKQFFCGCCCQEAVEIDSTIKSSSCCLSSNMVHHLHPWIAKENGSVLISWNSKGIWKLFEECPADYGTFSKYQLTQQHNVCDPQCRFKILTMGVTKFDREQMSWEKIHNKDLHDSCTLVYMQDGGDIFGSLVLIVLFLHWWWQRKEKTQGRLSRRWVLRRKEARRREARAKNPNLILDGPR